MSLTFLSMATTGSGQTLEAPEYDIKAAFIYNFAKSIELPSASAPGEDVFTLCVLGKDPFGAALNSIEGSAIGGRTLAVRRMVESRDAHSCQFLFISSSEESRMSDTLESLEGSGVVTVGETERFVEMGGMIQFVALEDRVQFIINEDAARSSGVRISTELLQFSARAETAWKAAIPWYEHYSKAEEALRSSDWEKCVQEINHALEKKGDSGLRVRTSGSDTVSYFPYLKLGIAYYRLGQLDAAIQAFETEERLGAIGRSENALGELRRFRAQVENARRIAADEELRRIRQILLESLDQAKANAAEGDLDAAMTAMSRGLAVSPGDPEALAYMETLRGMVARQQHRRELERRVATLTTQGRAFLDAGQYSEASSALSQAVALQPTTDLQALFDEAQRRLLEEIEEKQGTEQKRVMINDTLKQASGLETSGDLEAALERLQSVIALDPGNEEAQRLQNRLLEARARAEAERTRLDSIRILLTDAEAHIEGGHYEASLSTANQILALDPSNATALRCVAEAYRQINQRLLGSGKSRTIPPAIRFADFREEVDEGIQVQRVSSPDFRLGGVVIDDSPVDLVFYDDSNRVLRIDTRSQPLGDYYITEFNLRHRVAPGLSSIRLIATDAQELTSSSEYSVFYAPPFYRSPWFYVLMGVGLVVATGSVWGHRIRRRNRLLLRRYNPYVAGPPVFDENLFFGREQLLDRILRTVHNNSMLLHGERRIGKTSIQHHLKRRLQGLQDPRYDFYPVYIDLQGVTEDRFFGAMAQDIFQELAPSIPGVEPAPTLTNGDPYSYGDFVHDLRRILKALHQRSSKKVRLVLLIDEVDELNDYDPKVNQRLRSLFMRNFAENLVAVVAGVAIKKQWAKEGSPWYNFFEEVEIRPFRRSDAEDLIEKPIRGIFRMEEGLVDRIITRTNCKPYAIQKLCAALVNRVYDENRRTITIADLEAVGQIEEV